MKKRVFAIASLIILVLMNSEAANAKKNATQPAGIDRTQSKIFSADETADVDVDDATPVIGGIGEGPQTRFTGKIEKVEVEVK